MISIKLEPHGKGDNMSYLHNIMMAQVLQERGIIQATHPITTRQDKPTIPDVLVNYNGLRTVIDGQVGALPHYQHTLESARQRVARGIAHIGVAVVYPEILRHQPRSTLKRSLPDSKLAIATVTEAQETDFTSGNVDYVEERLRQAFEQLTRDDMVSKAVKLLDAGIEEFARVTATKPHVLARLSVKLGIPEQTSKLPSAKSMAALPIEQRFAICRISGLVIVNAMISQALLAKHDKRVAPLPPMLQSECLPIALIDHWDFIMGNINYYSLFNLATHLLEGLTVTRDIIAGLQNLVRIAHRIVSKQGLALRHDLMGRVYHRLLSEAKYLGIFYTTIPAASLLLKLALDTNYRWHDLKALQNLRIADLSCGTGTLLMSAADAVTDNYVSAVASQGQTPDNAGLHRALLEKILYGYDVLPSAVHLTASTLALRAPRIIYESMNLFSLPLGGKKKRLGSVEFLNSSHLPLPTDLFTPSLKAVDQQEDEVVLPQLDLCVINPPFTRSVGGNLLFGSVSERERKAMQHKLKEMVRKPEIRANTTAGLGSVFVAVADKHLKVGGRLALVLPKALISGVAWEATRALLRNRYRVDYLITSHDPKRWNFSESTELSELLLVATKLADYDVEIDGTDCATFGLPTTMARQSNNGDPKQNSLESNASGFDFEIEPQALAFAFNKPNSASAKHSDSPQMLKRAILPKKQPEDQVVAVNLWHNPNNSFEALAVAFALTHQGDVPNVSSPSTARTVMVGDTKIAEAISLPWSELKTKADWMLPSSFAQADLVRVAYHLERGQVWMPGIGPVGNVPLAPLGQFGSLGPDRRDIHDAFTQAKRSTDYPAFWGQSAKINTLDQQPNRHLKPVTKAKKGRPWRDPDTMWGKTGRLLLLERLRLNTQSLVAVRLSQPVLSNMWWEFSYNGHRPVEAVEKALALWLNSTLGLFTLLTHRQETQGAWVAFKKPVLTRLPVLDINRLTDDQLADLTFAYDEVAHETLFPFPEMHIDPVRAEIDRHLSQTLDLPELDDLRDRLAVEPVVCAQRLEG